MRKIFILITFLISLHSFSQDAKIIAYQKERFEYAISFLEKSELENAADLFSYVQHLNPSNDLGKIASRKVDSLKPLIRKRFIEKITGKWKMVKENLNSSSTDIDKYILIENYQISFYEQNRSSKEMILVRIEKMKFIDQLGMNRSFTEFADSKKQIWSCLLNESNGILRVINTGEETENGRTEGVDNMEYKYEKVQ